MKRRITLKPRRLKGAGPMRVVLALLMAATATIPSTAQTRPRGRDLGIPFAGQTGSANARCCPNLCPGRGPGRSHRARRTAGQGARRSRPTMKVVVPSS